MSNPSAPSSRRTGRAHRPRSGARRPRLRRSADGGAAARLPCGRHASDSGLHDIALTGTVLALLPALPLADRAVHTGTARPDG
ncbi:hypothetical protein [Streptomyces sp. NPDC101393]|uniref:hypothetical protein n=1 Tax=Streptomyces sp. NPDC101393 TaxID=3366141 RepID=UPI003800C70C